MVLTRSMLGPALLSPLRIAIGLAILFATSTLRAETFTGRVVGVTDGDTLKLLTDFKQSVKIRLAGIDSPEKAQDFGQRAKQNLSDLAFDREAIAECTKRDRYQRLICVVSVDGTDVGLEQVRAGMAWWYRQFISEQTVSQRTKYEIAEATAKAARTGLWSQPSPIPPWDWRKGMRLDE